MDHPPWLYLNQSGLRIYRLLSRTLSAPKSLANAKALSAFFGTNSNYASGALKIPNHFGLGFKNEDIRNTI